MNSPKTISHSGKHQQTKGSERIERSQPTAGGELYQTAGGEHPALTTNQGVALSDNQNSLRANPRGPTLLEDFILREKITHFDHERIPERIVHARGTGAHGFFELTASLKPYTTAKILTEVGEKTPVFTRISTVAGGAGSVDTPRDVRGFAVKFYTKEGNWDYISLTPESMHMVMWIMSDRTIPRSLRMIEGFGVHSFRLINAKGESTFVKFHWRPKLGLQSTVWDEAVKIAGADPDFHRRDMFEAISTGNFPEWEFAVQLFTEEDAEGFADHYSQARQFYLSQTEHEQAHIASALVFELSKVTHTHVREAIVGHLRHIEESLAKRVATGLAFGSMPAAPKAAMPVKEMEPSSALQIIGKMKDTLKGRAVGILIADGSDGAIIRKVEKAVTEAGASVKIIAPKVGGAKLADGSMLAADGQLTGTPSVLFDAVAILLSEEGANMLSQESAAIDFARDAFGHLKAIAVDKGGQALLTTANVGKDAGVVDATETDAFVTAAKTRQWSREKTVRALA